MSFTRTLTATVAALYLSIGSASAEEPKSDSEKVHYKTGKQSLSCGRDWWNLLLRNSTDGLNKPQRIQLELQLDEDSYFNMGGVVNRHLVYEMVNVCVYEGYKQNTPEKLTCFFIQQNELTKVDVTMVTDDLELDLSNPKVRKAAERKFCGYVKQVVAKYKNGHRKVEENRVQKQLELLK